MLRLLCLGRGFFSCGQRREDVGAGEYGLASQGADAGFVQCGVDALLPLAFFGCFAAAAHSGVVILNGVDGSVKTLANIGGDVAEELAIGGDGFECFCERTQLFQEVGVEG